MSPDRVQRIVIVGGGTAGWTSAAVLARFLEPQGVAIRVVESSDIGTVGVGEGTVPLIRLMHRKLEIDERQFICKTQATFKLGIEFRDWGSLGNVHFNGFGDYGGTIEGISPHHHWLKLHRLGDPTPLGDYSFPTVASRSGRFAPADRRRPTDASFCDYAYHFDTTLYGQLLRGYAEQRGVRRTDAKVVDVRLNADSGFIEKIVLDSGEHVEGDLFIDCTGFAGLLIERALHTGYEDWSHWLPCDSALAVPSVRKEPLLPCTLSTARAAGWQWRIPLQHRTGNGYVYCSKLSSDADAARTLLEHLDSPALADPRQLRFTTGRRRKFWNGNCVAIGLAAGFMEPLEATSIMLIQTGIARLIDLFPDKSFDPVIREEYNSRTTCEYERIRDFLILHYHATQRDDSPLWQYCRTMSIPDSLQNKLTLFRSRALVRLGPGESFTEASWVAIFIGQDVLPRRYDPIIDGIDLPTLQRGMAQRRVAIRQAAEAMPLQSEFIARNCAAPT